MLLGRNFLRLCRAILRTPCSVEVSRRFVESNWWIFRHSEAGLALILNRDADHRQITHWRRLMVSEGTVKPPLRGGS